MSPAASRYHFDVTMLVRSPKRNDDEGLRSQVAEFEAMLGKRRSEVARVKSGLDVFEISYRQRVGILHGQLDQLELEIAEADLGELSKGVDSAAGGPAQPPAVERSTPPPRYTSDAARTLFRDVAKAIHPDLARDESTRNRRHNVRSTPRSDCQDEPGIDQNANP